MMSSSSITSKAFRPAILPSQSSSHRPSDNFRGPSSSFAGTTGQHGSQSLGGSISLRWGVSSGFTIQVQIQGGQWEIGVGAICLSSSNNNNITASRRSRDARLLSAAGKRSPPFSGAARMAPELCAGEPSVAAAAADGKKTAAQNEEEEERGTEKLGAVFFDMDDTLVLTHEVDSQAHLAVMALVAVRAPQVDQSAVLRGFLKRFENEAWDPEHKVEVTEWRARLWGMALGCEGVEDMNLARDLQNCFDRERLAGFRWTTGVERLVRTLHRQGIKVGIITNGHSQVQRAKLKACNAEELFDTILVGGEEPDMKPHRDIFIKACNLAGCKPEESIMVGDTIKTDIQGGINAGFLSTVWVNVYNRQPRPGTATPDHEITTFIELQHVLEQYGVVFEASE